MPAPILNLLSNRASNSSTRAQSIDSGASSGNAELESGTKSADSSSFEKGLALETQQLEGKRSRQQAALNTIPMGNPLPQNSTQESIGLASIQSSDNALQGAKDETERLDSLTLDGADEITNLAFLGSQDLANPMVGETNFAKQDLAEQALGNQEFTDRQPIDVDFKTMALDQAAESNNQHAASNDIVISDRLTQTTKLAETMGLQTEQHPNSPSALISQNLAQSDGTENSDLPIAEVETNKVLSEPPKVNKPSEDITAAVVQLGKKIAPDSKMNDKVSEKLPLNNPPTLDNEKPRQIVASQNEEVINSDKQKPLSSKTLTEIFSAGLTDNKAKRLLSNQKLVQNQTLDNLTEPLKSQHSFEPIQPNAITPHLSSQTNLQPSSMIQNGLSLGHEFSPNLALRIKWIYKQAISSAEILMDPEDLGPMSIKMQNHKGETNIIFHVNNPQTKNMIEDNLDKLKELLADQGINLGETQIEHQHQEHTESESKPSKNLTNRNVVAEVDEQIDPQAPMVHAGLLDAYI